MQAHNRILYGLDQHHYILATINKHVQDQKVIYIQIIGIYCKPTLKLLLFSIVASWITFAKVAKILHRKLEKHFLISSKFQALQGMHHEFLQIIEIFWHIFNKPIFNSCNQGISFLVRYNYIILTSMMHEHIGVFSLSISWFSNVAMEVRVDPTYTIVYYLLCSWIMWKREFCM